MKASELRLNNIVNNKYDELEYNIVTGVDSDNIYFNNITFDYVQHEDVEPIPLTEEWLVKFGFERNKLNNGWKGMKVYLSQYSNDKRIWYDNELDLKSVHQLQNLYFALTGEELTIK